jgi:hypothetical protein
VLDVRDPDIGGCVHEPLLEYTVPIGRAMVVDAYAFDGYE